MTEPCEQLCQAIGKSIVDRDFAATHALCAPWLKITMSVSEIERQIDAAGEGLELPVEFSTDEGFAGLDELRTPDPYGPPSRPFARDITAGNFKGWLSILFTPDPSSEEQNVCFELWIAAVEVDGQYLAGYFEAAEPS